MEIRLPRGYFCDEPVKSQQVNGLTLAETAYPPNHKLPRHSHNRSCLMIVLQGAVTESYRNESFLAKPSTLIFRPSGEVHSDQFYGSGGRLFIIEMEKDWLNRVSECSLSLRKLVGFSGGWISSLSHRLYKEFREMDNLSHLVIEGLMLEIMVETSRCSADVSVRRPPHWLKYATELLHARFSEHLTMACIAKIIGVHPVHLAQAFRRTYRCSPGEYVRRLRVEFACHQLTTSDSPLADIALAAGFSDQSHLSRTFKRQMGMTPRHYRSIFRAT